MRFLFFLTGVWLGPRALGRHAPWAGNACVSRRRGCVCTTPAGWDEREWGVAGDCMGSPAEKCVSEEERGHWCTHTSVPLPSALPFLPLPTSQPSLMLTAATTTRAAPVLPTRTTARRAAVRVQAVPNKVRMQRASERSAFPSGALWVAPPLPGRGHPSNRTSDAPFSGCRAGIGHEHAPCTVRVPAHCPEAPLRRDEKIPPFPLYPLTDPLSPSGLLQPGLGCRPGCRPDGRLARPGREWHAPPSPRGRGYPGGPPLHGLPLRDRAARQGRCVGRVRPARGRPVAVLGVHQRRQRGQGGARPLL